MDYDMINIGEIIGEDIIYLSNKIKAFINKIYSFIVKT